jgi:hypothetical protein
LSSNVPDRVAEAKFFADLTTRCGNAVSCVFMLSVKFITRPLNA